MLCCVCICTFLLGKVSDNRRTCTCGSAYVGFRPSRPSFVAGVGSDQMKLKLSSVE